MVTERLFEMFCTPPHMANSHPVFLYHFHSLTPLLSDTMFPLFLWSTTQLLTDMIRQQAQDVEEQRDTYAHSAWYNMSHTVW